LFLLGDNIDGVGIYQGQDKDLNIKSCFGQYNKLEEILKKIRKDVKIIIIPGQHDAVWVGEQQFKILKKWAPGLQSMENVILAKNPSLVEISEGFKVLIYHGAGINRFIDYITRIRTGFGHKNPVEVSIEMLKRRHLSPTHGLFDYVPDKNNDEMVIKEVPDIFVTGDQHRAGVKTYNNILVISTSCFQEKTAFEEKVGNVPIPARVPLLNLKTREIKILDFSGDEING
jgi:DNA polymerase II small subunit